MARLRSKFSAYGTDTSHLCATALNSKNIDHMCHIDAAVI